MGKRIKSRARGKGGPRYRVPSHKWAGKVEFYLSKDVSYGIVKDIIHDPGRNAPLSVVEFPDKTVKLHIAVDGIKVGDKINYWENLSLGSVLPVSKIPEGMKICCIEAYPGSGPKFCRSSGTFATVIGKLKGKVRIMFSNGKIKEVNENCLAMVGVPAGWGRTSKPFLKAGQKHYKSLVRGKIWPVVKGVSMNAVDHPFGGKTKPGIPKSVSRHAPPGRKVGAISPRRMGRRKK